MTMCNLGNENKVRLHRTKESTLFEFICGVVLIVMWADVAFHWSAIKEIEAVLIGNVVGTGCIVLELALAYRPDQINWPVRIKQLSLYVLLAQATRVMAVEMSVMFAVLSFGMVHQGAFLEATGMVETAFVILIFVTIAVYIWRMRRAS